MTGGASWGQIRPGPLLLRYYYRPLGKLRQIIEQGGPFAMRETERQRAEMERAAALLPALPIPQSDTALRLHVLTGKRFWYQTAFCLHSFATAAAEPVQIEIYDDGTLDEQYSALLLRLGPAVTIHRQEDILSRLDRHLPAGKFPVIRRLWAEYPHIRKLTDIHVGSIGWKLVIDSDLLFFRKPDLLLAWMRDPQNPLQAVDCEESYGYTKPLMGRLAGCEIPSLVNVGLCGLRSESLDWGELEMWCKEMIEKERQSYFLEQALVAMLVARFSSRTVAPRESYVTLPERREVLSPKAVMHHYVANSKRWYFRTGWRHVAPTAASR